MRGCSINQRPLASVSWFMNSSVWKERDVFGGGSQFFCLRNWVAAVFWWWLVRWCNGSTRPFGGFSHGSSPCRTANFSFRVSTQSRFFSAGVGGRCLASPVRGAFDFFAISIYGLNRVAQPHVAQALDRLTGFRLNKKSNPVPPVNPICPERNRPPKPSKPTTPYCRFLSFLWRGGYVRGQPV